MSVLYCCVCAFYHNYVCLITISILYCHVCTLLSRLYLTVMSVPYCHVYTLLSCLYLIVMSTLYCRVSCLPCARPVVRHFSVCSPSLCKATVVALQTETGSGQPAVLASCFDRPVLAFVCVCVCACVRA